MHQPEKRIKEVHRLTLTGMEEEDTIPLAGEELVMVLNYTRQRQGKEDLPAASSEEILTVNSSVMAFS